MRKSLVLALALGTVVPSSARSQSSWDRYKPGTLRTIVAEHDTEVGTACDTVRPCTMISAKDFATATHVTFLGEWQPLSPETIKHITTWAKTFRIDTAVAASFAQELLVREDSLEYWLPMQRVLVDAFKSEVPTGHGATLLAIFTGGYVERNEPPRWVFLVNEFQADD